MKTGLITFNVTERGRKHRGQPRNFDTAALAELINGPEVQERVRNRDMKGFFGHWPREMFGIEPGEGGIYDGKQITLEPALITTQLTAKPDGTISHEAEFLDTAPGRTAKRVYGSRAGGFSSAINCREFGGRDVPIGFHGFDYVMEPNFTRNRGYALDGVFEAPERSMVLDDAMQGWAALKVQDALYTALQADYDRMSQAMARMAAENSDLVAMVAAANASRGVLDHTEAAPSVGQASHGVRRVQRLDESRMMREAKRFSALRLDDVAPRNIDDDPGKVARLSEFVTGLFRNGGRL